MRLKTIAIKVKPKEGDTKQVKKFAWWPKKVRDQLVWLEHYIVVYKFTIRERIHAFQGYGFLRVTGGGWDEIEKMLLGPEPNPIDYWGGEPLNTRKNAHP